MHSIIPYILSEAYCRIIRVIIIWVFCYQGAEYLKQYSNNIVIFLISLWFSQQLIKWRTSSSAENHSVEQRRNCLGHNLHRGLFFVKYVNLLNARQNIFAGKQNFPEHDIDYSKESKMYFYSRIVSHSNVLIWSPNLATKNVESSVILATFVLCFLGTNYGNYPHWVCELSAGIYQAHEKSTYQRIKRRRDGIRTMDVQGAFASL